jgi:hypothetical protein
MTHFIVDAALTFLGSALLSKFKWWELIERLIYRQILKQVDDDCAEIDRRIKDYFGDAFNDVAGIVDLKDMGKDKGIYQRLLDKRYSILKLLKQ